MQYMTHREALQYFPDTIQVSLHKNNKINLPLLQDVLKMMSLHKHIFSRTQVPTILGENILVQIKTRFNKKKKKF
jgi:hypothetical protein